MMNGKVCKKNAVLIIATVICGLFNTILAEGATINGDFKTIDSGGKKKNVSFDHTAYKQAPIELIFNGSLSKGWVVESIDKYAVAFKWYLENGEKDDVKVDYRDGILLVKRLKPAEALRLRNSNVVLDTTENYRFKTRVRQRGGSDGRIRLFGGKKWKIPASGDWVDLQFDVHIPAINGKSNLGRTGSLIYYMPSKIDSSLEIDYASLFPIFPPNNLPKNPKVFIEQKEEKLPMEAIFVHSEASEGELLAAHSLRRNLFLYCGYVIPVYYLEKGKTPAIPGVYVGRSAMEQGLICNNELKSLGQCGYILRSKNGALGIKGKTDSGTICGVFGLLGDYGIHNLLRYKFDVVLPDVTEILIREQDVLRKPSFEYTGTDGYDGLAGIPFGYSWVKPFMGNPSDLGVNNAYWVHSANYLCPYEIYGRDHPEYYALDEITNKRLKCDPENRKRLHIHLCYSNPEVQKIATERLLKWMDAQKDRKYFPVTAGDGMGFCNCENCRKWDFDPEAYNKSDRYMRFVNILARAAGKKFPNKRIMYLAYTARTEDTPTQVKPEQNVNVIYCLWSSDWPCKQHAFCDRNNEGVNNFEKWIKLMPGRVHIFDYPAYVLADMKRLCFFRDKGVVGIIHCSFRGVSPALLCWVFGKAFWNIELNVDKEIDNFMTLYYGPAAPAMRQYLDLLQNAIDLYQHDASEKKGDRPKAITPIYPDRGEPFLLTFKEMDKGFEYLEAAQKAAEENPVFLARIQKYKNDLLLIDLTQRNLVKGLSGVARKVFVNRLAEFLKKDNRKSAFRKKPINLWLKNIAHLEVKMKNWRKDKNVQAFLADPEAFDFEGRGQKDIENGWLLLSGFSMGGEHMSIRGQECTIVRPSRINTTTFILTLSKKPTSDMKLTVCGLDDDKPGEVLFEISVNGQTVYNGINPFDDKKWTTVKYTVPAASWKTGKNQIKFINRTSNEGASEPGTPQKAAEKRSRRRGNWGWFGIGYVKVTNM